MSFSISTYVKQLSEGIYWKIIEIICLVWYNDQRLQEECKMKKRRLLLIVLGSVLTLWLLVFIFPRQHNFSDTNPLRVMNGAPMLIAHGGGNQEFPDNTLEAFYNAYAVDPNVMMETDVSMTKDGVIILSHDTTLDRKTSLVNASISDITYTYLVEEEIDFSYHNQVEPRSNGFNVSGELIRYKNYLGDEVSPLDISYPEGVLPRHESKFLVTTLEELITSFPNNYINVEIKQSGEVGLQALEATIALLDELDEEYNTYARIVLASFHKTIYQELQELKRSTHPQLMFSPEATSVTRFFVLFILGLDVFYGDEVAVFQLPMEQMGLNLATKRLVRVAHRHNIAVNYWTINDADDMRKLIAIKADGIMTDRPNLLKSVLEE